MLGIALVLLASLAWGVAPLFSRKGLQHFFCVRFIQYGEGDVIVFFDDCYRSYYICRPAAYSVYH